MAQKELHFFYLIEDCGLHFIIFKSELIESLWTDIKRSYFYLMGEEVEKDIISVSPDIAMSKGGNLRRSSAGHATTGTSLPSSNGAEKVLPHYLRASTNSCHDFCKYGRKHAFEAKERRPIRHKVTRNARDSVEDQDQIKNVNLGDRKKKPMVKLKATPELKIELLEKPTIIKQKAFPSVKKTEISIKPAMASKQGSVTAKSSLPSNQSGVPSGRSSSVNSPLNPLGTLDGRKISDSIPLSPSQKGNVRKIGRRSPSNHSSGLSGGRNSEKEASSPSGGNLTVRRNGEKKIVQKTGLSKSGERKKPPIASFSPKPVNQVPSLKPLTYRSPKTISPKMNQNRSRKAEPNDEQIMEKTLYVIEPKTKDESLKPVEHDETINRASRSSLSLSSLSSCPSLSSDEEEEANEESEPELNEGDNTYCKHDKTGKIKAEDSKGGDNRRLRRSAMTCPEDKDCAPQKLRFQRGKVVSLDRVNSGPRRLRFRPGRVVGENQEESENSGPKRLKFRQGRVMGENQESENSGLQRLKFMQGRVMGENQESSENSGLKRLKFRQGRVMGVSLSGKSLIGRRSFRRNRDLGGGDANATKAGTPSVVLRHQDMQGKKEEQGLFNDVIEETANKLVETRKSKVKALVGAFETVISLQESKPAATV
ncbi:hypothetical protein AAC387_Pa03g3278 [Persea americana]